ncbi:MAG: hypothetical protein KGL16_06315, partial [Acidobacteriota bacterium]|nr:hypothetical protein [Acidobacteriota bacterium]
TQPSFNLSSGGATPSQQAATSSTPASSSTASASGGLSGVDAAIIAVVAALLLGGVAFWIWYDSRGHAARAGHGDDALFGQRAHAGSKAPPKQRKLTPAERKRRKRGRAR